MLIEVENYSIHCNPELENFDSNKTPIIFIHGFTGSSNEWDNVVKDIDSRFSPITFDLIGHGKSDAPNNPDYYVREKLILQIKAIYNIYNFDKAIICGYSMGGRVALAFSVDHPELVKGLILESSSPGIENLDERAKRKEEDLKLADKILVRGIEEFLDYWQNIDLFKSQKKLPEKVQKKIRLNKLGSSPIGLSNSLRGFSTGIMPSYWEELINLDFPVKLIAGELDQKFVDIKKMMNKKLPDSYLSIIESSGHNTHLEKPREFVSLINRFIGNLLK